MSPLHWFVLETAHLPALSDLLLRRGSQICQIAAPGFILLLQSENYEVQHHHQHRTRCSIIRAALRTWPTLRIPALRCDLWLPERWRRTVATSDGVWNTGGEWSPSAVSQWEGSGNGTLFSAALWLRHETAALWKLVQYYMSFIISKFLRVFTVDRENKFCFAL